MSLPSPHTAARAGKSTAARPPALRGVGLVELMVSLVIGLLLILVIASVYLGSRTTHRSGEAISRLQESGRFAFGFLARDIRQSGFVGCGGATVTMFNALNNSTNLEYDFARPIFGYDTGTNDTSWNATPPSMITSPKPGSDILIVRSIVGGGSGVSLHTGSIDQPGSEPIQVSTANNFAANDVVMAVNCLGAAVFQLSDVTTAASTMTLDHATGGTAPGNASAQLGREFTDGEVYKLSSFAFYVRDNSAGVPSLYRREISLPGSQAQELVEGVEKMQILYGIDSNDDRSADDYISGAEVQAGDLWRRVVSVRLELLVRSPDDNASDVSPIYRIGGDDYRAPDRRLRQVLTTTIALRNRVN